MRKRTRTRAILMRPRASLLIRLFVGKSSAALYMTGYITSLEGMKSIAFVLIPVTAHTNGCSGLRAQWVEIVQIR